MHKDKVQALVACVVSYLNLTLPLEASVAQWFSYSPSKPGVVGSVPGFSSLSDETLNRGPMTIFKDKRLTMIDCDEAEDYVVPNVLSPRDLVLRPDIGQKLYHHHLPVQATLRYI